MYMDKNRKKKDDWDDGRVIAPMDALDPEWERGKTKRTKDKQPDIDLTKKEKRAMTKAMFAVMLPRILVALIAFAIVFLLVYLWLN